MWMGPVLLSYALQWQQLNGIHWGGTTVARASRDVGAAIALNNSLSACESHHQVLECLDSCSYSVHRLGFQNALTALHRFARHKNPGACATRQQVADRVARLLLTPHERQSQPTAGMLGNALWACGRLNDVIDWSGVVEGVGRRAIIDDKMLPHHIAHFMWGSASCYSVATEDRQREQIVELVKKVMMEFSRRDGTGFESRHIANIVWSLGTIQLPLSGDFLLRLLNSCTAVSSHLKDQEDSNTIWGLARLSAVAPPAAGEGVHAIRRYIVGRVLQRTSWSTLRPEEFAMMLWGVAVGVGQEADAAVLERLSAAASSLAGKMVSEPSSHRAIANTLWAFATLRHADDNLLRFTSLACPAVVQSGSGRHLSNIVCALSDLGCSIPDDLLTAAIKACSYPPTNATGRHAAGLLRAVAASLRRREVEAAELEPLVATVWSSYDVEEEATARQLFIAALWSSLCTPSPLIKDRRKIDVIISGAMQGFAVDDAASSHTHAEVAMVLRRFLTSSMAIALSSAASHLWSARQCLLLLWLRFMAASVSSPGVKSSNFNLTKMSERDLLIASFVAKHRLDHQAATAVLLDLTSHDMNVIVAAFEPSLANGADKEALLRRFVQVYFEQKTQAFIGLWGLPEPLTKDVLGRLNYKGPWLGDGTLCC
ncbi:hypothetical protein FOZ60_004606 [Perkinsus olseni]|uniref:Uncharacterized protein n=1 Tax=Perkinsus olseni TaxID=32597 RepID=A0A7J6NTV6_PEROL|nr:hypothetical protein FOZ60_004606 [Perkinsus olseni]